MGTTINPGEVGTVPGRLPVGLDRIELVSALSAEGCPLCRVGRRAAQRYLHRLLHEYVLDGGVRSGLHRARGFCREHAWQLQRLEIDDWRDNMGTATLYEDLARAVARKIRAAGAAPADRRRWFPRWAPGISPLARVPRPTGECPACASARFKEEYTTDLLLRALEGDAEIREQFQSSFGLCLPHFLAAVEAATSPQVRELLVDLEARKLETLAAELGDYVRKLTVDHQHEPKGQEQTSPIRVIEQFVGKPGA